MGKSQPQVSAHFHSAKTFFRVRRMVSRSTLLPGSTPRAPEHRRMIAIALGKRLRAIFVSQVDAVFDRQRGELRAHVFPYAARRGSPSRSRHRCAIARASAQYSSSKVGFQVSRGGWFSCAGMTGGPST